MFVITLFGLLGMVGLDLFGLLGMIVFGHLGMVVFGLVVLGLFGLLYGFVQIGFEMGLDLVHVRTQMRFGLSLVHPCMMTFCSLIFHILSIYLTALFCQSLLNLLSFHQRLCFYFFFVSLKPFLMGVVVYQGMVSCHKFCPLVG